MRKTHYIPITADVPGAANDANCALIRRTIRTALAAEGLTAPCEVDVLFTDDEGIREINREGTTVLFVEQNSKIALTTAQRGYVLQTGHMILTDTCESLLHNEDVRKAYLGEE